MTTNQNHILLPNKYHPRIQITLNPTTKETELKVVNGQLTHIQVIGLLMEHATALLRKSMVHPNANPLMGEENNAS